jgi:hypothetical protein
MFVEQRSKKSYALIIGTYLTFFAMVAAMTSRNGRRLKETPPARDIALIGIATYRLSRLVTYDRVTSVLRQPFVEEGRGEENLEGTIQRPKGTGLQRALGELLTCSWCASVWSGTINVAAYTLFPRVGRMFLMVLAASGISEILDPVFPLLNYLAGYTKDKQDELHRRRKERTI